MFFRYFKATLKKSPGNAIFPLIFMIPIIVLMTINTLGIIGKSYQMYRFHKNSNFTNMVYVVDSSDNSFCPITYPLRGQYIEEYSTKDMPFYNTNTTPMIYFCKSADALEISYFTEGNLLEGELPDSENFEELQKKGLFPICISYEAAQKSDSWIGDVLYLKSDRGYDTYGFEITGILQPDGMALPPLACALTDAQFFDAIPEILGFENISYCNFYTETRIINGQISNATMEEMQQIISSDFFSIDKIAELLFSVLIIIVVSIITYSLLKFRIKSDVRILSTMGMYSSDVLMIHFLRAVFAIVISVVLSTVFIKFICLPFIINEYYPFTFIGAIGLAELVIGLITCAVMAFILRRK